MIFNLSSAAGWMWLNSECTDRFGKAYVYCRTDQQKQVLDLIAYRKNVASAPVLSLGIEFFSFLRKFVADGYFTSEVGVKYLEYIGNTSLTEFPGCPEVTEA